MPNQSNLEAVMTVQGRKQKWLADRLGVHESEVSRYINGSKPMPDELLRKAAKILGVPAEMLQSNGSEPVESVAS